MRRGIFLWIFLIVLAVVGLVLAILLFSRSGDVRETSSLPERSVIEKLASLVRSPGTVFRKFDTPAVGQQTQPKDKFVMSYGEKDGNEQQLVRGVVVGWGETFLEIETADRANYALLLPDKTLQVRCLPETITTSSGQVIPTRNVYVDMTNDPYKGVLMSVYTAPTVLPVGSEGNMPKPSGTPANERAFFVRAGDGLVQLVSMPPKGR